MQFLSLDWIGWLLGTIAVYWVLPAQIRQWFLVATTLVFVAVHSPVSLLILVTFTVTTHLAARQAVLTSKWALVTAAGILAVLIFFKAGLSQATDADPVDGVIPLGLSYYTFRCLHLLLERLRRSIAPLSFAETAGYLCFLPTVVVGPIHRAPAYLRDRKTMRWTADGTSEGLERIVFGYFKIAVLGNFLVTGHLGDLIRRLGSEHTFLVEYLKMVRTGLNLYFQFAGFSDVAIGFALLLGFRVIENFDWPYLSRNIAEFWRSWHISLASWSRDYVYMPLLGLTRNPYYATIASFLMIGLWHELSLRYTLWGLYHAAGVLIYQQWLKLKRRYRLPVARSRLAKSLAGGLATLITVHFVWLSFAMVRQPDLQSMSRMLRNLTAWG